jgi:ribosomal protein L7/L12
MSKFKVGDRVRLTEKYGLAKAGDEGVVTGFWDDDGLDVLFSGVSHGLFARRVEPVEQPAAFKIEAGKFYKTRNGRKVGPMRAVGANEFYDPEWKWRSPQEISPVNDQGNWHVDRIEHPKDLVAEWIDEPTKANDNVVLIKNQAIVCLIENGQPKPSVNPFVHNSAEAAGTEAKRLARKHLDKTFGVYVLQSTAAEAAPTYRHEWQRLAAKGEKISAIKELRSITGLGLKATKDAVEHWLAHDEPVSRIAA